jgi:hypothetical protein
VEFALFCSFVLGFSIGLVEVCFWQEEVNREKNADSGSSADMCKPSDVDWAVMLKKNPSLQRAFYSFTQTEKYQSWNKDYDAINWEEELQKNPKLAAALGGPVGGGEGQKICTNFAPTLGSNSSFLNCFNFTFQICGGSSTDAAKEKAEKEGTKGDQK